MKLFYLMAVISICACNGIITTGETINGEDTVSVNVDSTDTVEPEKKVTPATRERSYSNSRFKDVTAKKLGDNTYEIAGRGQIFEANFGWIVEDGHEELKKGFQMTDAGAPEWGNFKFTIEVEKPRPNSTLTLVLYETSAKDGSRQYELPIVLE